MKVGRPAEQIVQEYLLALIEKLVAEGPPDNAHRRGN